MKIAAASASVADIVRAILLPKVQGVQLVQRVQRVLFKRFSSRRTSPNPLNRPDPTEPNEQDLLNRMNPMNQLNLGSRLKLILQRARFYDQCGFITTFTQPSCLSRNVRYICGASSSDTRWVTTNEGSISPVSM